MFKKPFSGVCQEIVCLLCALHVLIVVQLPEPLSPVWWESLCGYAPPIQHTHHTSFSTRIMCLFWESTSVIFQPAGESHVFSNMLSFSADNAKMVVAQTKHMDVKNTEESFLKRVFICRTFHYLWLHRINCCLRLGNTFSFFPLYTFYVINNDLWKRK